MEKAPNWVPFLVLVSYLESFQRVTVVKGVNFPVI